LQLQQAFHSACLYFSSLKTGCSDNHDSSVSIATSRMDAQESRFDSLQRQCFPTHYIITSAELPIRYSDEEGSLHQRKAHPGMQKCWAK
jgi:hypothetical protein